LLDEGTRHSSALEIAARIERLGGQVATGADWDTGYLSVEVLARHAGAGLELLAELAAEPAFPPAEIERERSQRLAELLRQRSDPGFVARERFARAVYGDHPYGGQLLGTPESLGGFDRPAFERFYRRHYAAAGACAVAVGDLDLEAVAAGLERALGGRDAAPPPRPDLTPPARPGIRVHLVDRPGAAQTELVIGHAGIPRTDPDYLAMAVLTTLLGGKFTSRINLNLRERLGVTYGASCRLHPRLGPGPLVVSTAVANPAAGAAVREVLGELARIRDQPVGGDELEETRSYLIGVFPYTLQTVDGVAGRLETLAVYGLPDDYYDAYPDRLRALDAGALQEVARRRLYPDDLAVVAVGPAAELGPQFEGLGEIAAQE
jgi:zinc protease